MKKKTVITAVSIGCGAIALLSGVLLAIPEKTTAGASVFGQANKVTITPDKSATDEQNGRKGILLSASDNGANVEFNGEMSGVFSPEFRPYSATAGVQDFGSLEFTFTSEESYMGFSVEFVSNASGVSMNYTISTNGVISKSLSVNGSFCGLDKEPISFTFNPYDMTVSNDKGTVFADMQSEEFMKEFLTSTTLPAWQKYNVSVRFSDIVENKTANVIFYEVSGQKLAGTTLVNTASAVFVTEPQTDKAVVNKAYTLPKEMVSYDILDGYKDTFNGKVEVFDAKGVAVKVTDGKFTPTVAGDYRLVYTLHDSASLAGEKKEYIVRAYEQAPEVNISYALPLENNELGVGSTLVLPKAKGYSDLSDTALPVEVQIINGTEKTTVTDSEYTFTKAGEYTVAYVSKDIAGTVAKSETKIVVSDIPSAEKLFVMSEYSVGETLSVSAVEFEKGGTVYGAKQTLTYPDGSSTDATSATLSQTGVYNLTWRFEYNGKTYQRTAYFNVVQKPQSLFEKTAGLTVTQNYTAPVYADKAYNGVLLTARQALNATFVNTFDISDNTAEDTLVEFFVSPAEEGSMEFEQIDIYFYDVHDESNFIHIRFVDDPWKYYFYAMSVIGTTTGDFDTSTDKLFRNYYYNHFVYSSFYGRDTSKGLYPSQSVRLSFDYETGKLYANVAATNSSLAEKKTASTYEIANLKDEAWVGAGNAFYSFTTGEARMVVRMSALKSTANMMILNVDGQSLSGTTLKDTEKPSVFVDYDGNDADNVPLGEVGKEYKLYRAYLQDVVGGYTENVTAEVYYLGAQREKVRVHNNAFTPDKTGKYEIVYTGQDASGYGAQTSVIVNVVEAGKIPAIEYEFAQMDNSLTQGETARFLAGYASGGTGKLYVDVKVLFGDKQIAMDENGCFKVTEAGTYTIEVRVSDYNGTSDPFVYSIDVAQTIQPLIYETTVNTAFRAGEKVTLPAFKAVTYDGNVEKQAEVKYYIDGKELPADRSWTPEKDTDKAYTFTVKAGESEKEYTLYASSATGEGKSFATSFFHATGATMSVSRTETKFALTEPETANVRFARAIDVNFFNFSLSVSTDTEEGAKEPNPTSFNKIIATLKDSVNPEEKVEIIIRKGVNAQGNENRAFCEVNGRSFEMRGEYANTATPLYVAYNPVDHTLSDDVGNALGKIYETYDGRVFRGFSSGSVYVDFRVDDIAQEKTSSLNVLQIAGQKFNSTIKKDNNGPMIKIAGSSGEINVGDTVTVYPAKAFDLLSGAKSIYVTVTLTGREKPLFDKVSCEEAFTFTVESYGTYSITYTACDNLDIVNEAFESISVADRTPPEIKLNGEIPEAVKLNGTYKLPTATVTDDYTQGTLYVYAIAPDAEMIWIKDYTFKPTQTGKYKIVYFAIDNQGSSSVKTFDVWVTK